MHNDLQNQEQDAGFPLKSSDSEARLATKCASDREEDELTSRREKAHQNFEVEAMFQTKGGMRVDICGRVSL